MRAKLTPQDECVFQHIVAFDFAHQRLPTLKELCFYTGMMRGQVNRHLARLVETGYLLALPHGTIHYAIIDPTRTIQHLPEQLVEESAA